MGFWKENECFDVIYCQLSTKYLNILKHFPYVWLYCQLYNMTMYINKEFSIIVLKTKKDDKRIKYSDFILFIYKFVGCYPLMYWLSSKYHA